VVLRSQGHTNVDGNKVVDDSVTLGSFRRHDLHHPICAAKFDQVGIKYVKPTSYINEALIVGLTFAHVPEYFHDKVGRFGNRVTSEEWFKKATPPPEGFSKNTTDAFIGHLSKIFHLAAKLGTLMKGSGLEKQFFNDLINSYHSGLDFNLNSNEILLLNKNEPPKLEIKAAAEFDPEKYNLYKPIVDEINDWIVQISQNPIMNDHGKITHT
jgi:hypothetical protein